MCRNIARVFYLWFFEGFFSYNNSQIHFTVELQNQLCWPRVGAVFFASSSGLCQGPSETTVPDKKGQICTRRKDAEVNDFTSEMNLNNGAHLLIGSWEEQRHKHHGLSYQAEAFRGETESSYLHCSLSYKVCRNAGLCTVCFTQRV